MTDMNIKNLIPVYASEDLPKHEKPRMTETGWFRSFKVNGGLWLIILFAWAASMMIGCCITGLIVRKTTTDRVTEEVTHKMRAEFQEYLNQQEEQRKKESFLTGDASLQAAINDLGKKLGIHVAGLRQDRKVTKAGAETYCYVDIARLLSGLYGKTIDDVLNGPVENYDENHPVRDEDLEIGMKVAAAVMTGHYPNGFTTDLQFAEINADGSVTARNKLKTDSTTVFWRIEE